MPASSVAAAGDVSAIAGAKTWTAGPVVVTNHPRLVVDGAPAISSATCTFTFTNGTTELLTLKATATVLQCDQVAVLVNGDQVVSSSQTGNTLTVSSTRKLQTS